MKVRQVLTDRGTDISGMLNETADSYASQYLGVLIAESNLREQALREGVWPDYSAGLSQVIAPNLGYGTYQKRATDKQLADYRAYMFDPANAIKQGWRWYSAALAKHVDPLWSALAYNRGLSYSTDQLRAQVETDPAVARKYERYRQSLDAAEKYAMTDSPYAIGPGVLEAMAAAGDEPRSDETYVKPLISETYGTKGIYVYFGEDNAVRFLPFEQGA